MPRDDNKNTVSVWAHNETFTCRRLSKILYDKVQGKREKKKGTIPPYNKTAHKRHLGTDIIGAVENCYKRE